MILLASDLDRTILPNGTEPESPEARPRFRELVQRDDLTLAYVSGRGRQLLQEAIEEYAIPRPAFAIGDVGTTIFVTHDGSWEPLEDWQQAIAKDWNGYTHEELKQLLDQTEGLTLQEEEKQNTFKLSFYTQEHIDRDALLTPIQQQLDLKGIQASLIWSVDEAAHTGLLDVLPKSATKLHAIEFLCSYLDLEKEQMVFAGDSGNDMPALVSGLNAVLVKNARKDVKTEAQKHLEASGQLDALYIAKGGFLGMNGNYSAGVLEGVAHFFPELF